MKPSEFLRKAIHYISLESELDDFDKIHDSIIKDTVFKGTNLWILVFAIIVASVGLNMNSTAVIIGAMLISPLMGPINGMGYSIATYNYDLFRLSIKNFGFAVIASLIASTAYFAISPISTAHSELLARTSPSIYDVLIALFGGLAGIVAISSKLKGNVIPGVAIATALMPPLCTAGYGLATAQFDFFFGAFYLFTINTVFIALSSVVISQILKFPIRTLVDSSQKKRVNRLISVVITVVILPSIYFGYVLVQKEKFVENATKYISAVSLHDGNYLLKSDINFQNKTITLVYGGINLSEKQKESIILNAKNFSLRNTNIIIEQGLVFDASINKNVEVLSLKEKLNKANIIIRQKESQIDSIQKRKYLGKTILLEIKNLYPQILKCSFSEVYAFDDMNINPAKTYLIVFTTRGYKLNNTEKAKINKWIQTRLNYKDIKVIYEESLN